MKAILGYNFMQDCDCLTPLPTNASNLNSIQIENGIFDHFNVTRDVASAYDTTIPQVWDFLTLLDASFNGNINAGNVEFVATEITSLKIKRRKVGEFNWITLYDIPIATAQDFVFTKTDYYNAQGQNYEYAFVPVINQNEGGYIINSIVSQINGVYICDADSIYKFYNQVQYGGTEQVAPVGVFEPFNRKYPIIVSNATKNYYKSSLQGTLLTQNSLSSGYIDRLSEVQYRQNLAQFLTNKNAKILKDWNGNIWLIMITSNLSISYINELGMGLASTSFEFAEIGDSNSQEDLFNNGLVDVFE